MTARTPQIKALSQMKIGEIGYIPLRSLKRSVRGKLIIAAELSYSTCASSINQLCCQRTRDGITIFPKSALEEKTILTSAHQLVWGERGDKLTFRITIAKRGTQ